MILLNFPENIELLQKFSKKFKLRSYYIDCPIFQGLKGPSCLMWIVPKK